MAILGSPRGYHRLVLSATLLHRLRHLNARLGWVWLLAMLAMAAAQAQPLRHAAAGGALGEPSLMDICSTPGGHASTAMADEAAAGAAHSHTDCCLAQCASSLAAAAPAAGGMAMVPTVQRSRRSDATPAPDTRHAWVPWRGRAPPRA